MRFMILLKANKSTEAEIEIRQLYEAADFGDEFTAVIEKQEQRLRTRNPAAGKEHGGMV